MRLSRHISGGKTMSQQSPSFLAECCRENATSRFVEAAGMLLIALTVVVCCLWAREWNHWDFMGLVAVLFLGQWARHTIHLGILDKYQAEKLDEQAARQATQYTGWDLAKPGSSDKSFETVCKLSGSATRGKKLSSH